MAVEETGGERTGEERRDGKGSDFQFRPPPFQNFWIRHCRLILISERIIRLTLGFIGASCRLCTVEPRKLCSYETKAHLISTRCRTVTVDVPIGVRIPQSILERHFLGNTLQWDHRRRQLTRASALRQSNSLSNASTKIEGGIGQFRKFGHKIVAMATSIERSQDE